MSITIIDHVDIDYYVKQILNSADSSLEEKVVRIIITNAFNAGRWDYYLEKTHNQIEELMNNTDQKLISG